MLEEVYELCKELAPAYEELTENLERIEHAYLECGPINTGQAREQLASQLSHNNVGGSRDDGACARLALILQTVLDTIHTERRPLAKFESNVDAIGELCQANDGAHLRQLCSQLHERLAEIDGAFRERGRALEATLASGGGGDAAARLDAFVDSLDAAATLARAADPIAARPPALRRQLDENAAAISMWEQKRPAYETMRRDATEHLAALASDPPRAAGPW